MSNPKPRAKTDSKADVRTPFKQMTRGQKAVYVAQVVVCLCTFGFVFPNSIGANDSHA